MTREQLTLAFGITLVLAVVVVSIGQNLRVNRRPEQDPPMTRSEEAGAPAAPAPDAAQDPAGTKPAPPLEEAPAPPRPRPAPAPEPVDASVAVVHRHRFGSCEGTLRATAVGLSYTTDHEDDAFRLPYSQLEQVALDERPPNLAVKQRDGRRWNFRPRTGDSSALASFYRTVQRARR